LWPSEPTPTPSGGTQQGTSNFLSLSNEFQIFSYLQLPS
jgi:hypothetical protein